MNSSMSPTWLICATFYVTVAARFIAYPLPTSNAVAGYDKANALPTLPPGAVDLRIRADEIPTYTITYASDSVCGYLSGSVQIPITCENKNRCLWELESFKYLACEIDGETTGIAHTKCLARDEALDPNLCEDDCVSNTYNLLCTNDTLPYCRTYAFPRGVRDYRCASLPPTRVSSVDFTYKGQKYPNFTISTFVDVDKSLSIPATSSISTTTDAEPAAASTTDTEPDKEKKGLDGAGIAGIVVGVVFGVVFSCAGIFCLRERRKGKKTQDTATLSESLPLGSKRNDMVVRQQPVAADDGPEVVHEADTSR